MIQINYSFVIAVERKLTKCLGDYRFEKDDFLVNRVIEFLSCYCPEIEFTIGQQYLHLRQSYDYNEETKKEKLNAYRMDINQDLGQIMNNYPVKFELDQLIKDIKCDFFGVEVDQDIQTLFLLIAIKSDMDHDKYPFGPYLREDVIRPMHPELFLFPLRALHAPHPPKHPELFLSPFPATQSPTLLDVNQLQMKHDDLKREISKLQDLLTTLQEESQVIVSERNLTEVHYFSASMTTARIAKRYQFLSFQQIVLHHLIQTDDESSLPPLQGKLTAAENRGEYYRQFMPYILNEVKETVKKQIQVITTKKLRPFRVDYIKSRESKNVDDSKDNLSRITVTLKNKDLPKLDHGFFQELVMIIIPESKTRDLQIYAIARADRHTEDSDEEESNSSERIIKLHIELTKMDFEIINSRHLKYFDIHWLAGLIPSQRMYYACQNIPRVSFESQFVHAELPEWPARNTSITPTDAVNALNPKQQETVMQLASAEEGLYLLQGPPGTGKTTTAAALIAQMIDQYPDKTMLVCAPSNQALRELLSKVSALSPKSSMALIGVGKNLPKEFNRVYVHHYAYSLYEPLIELKRKVQNSHNYDIETLAADAHVMMNNIQQELEDLITTSRSTLEQHKIDRFRSNIVSKLSEIVQQFNDSYFDDNTDDIKGIKILENYLEDCIKFMQKNAFYIEEFLVQRAQIVFATLVASGRPWLKKQRGSFDILIVDEAAQALIPEIIIPFTFASKLCIQIGDPQQLPPTIISKVAQEKGFNNSMMSKLMNNYNQPYEMLSVQYRMRSEICNWISQQFYNNQLTTDDSVASRPSLLLDNRNLSPGLKKPAIFFDVTNGKEERYGDELSASIKNEVEARAVVGLTCYLLFKCGFKAKGIGIITFYAAQVALIKLKFEEALRSNRQLNETQRRSIKRIY